MSKFVLGMISLSACLFGSKLCKPECVPTDCCCENSIVFAADFLYWEGMNQGFSLGVFTTEVFDGTPTVRGGVVRIDQTWDPGFRIGLGWNTCYDYWDLQARWTYYHNKATTTQTFNVLPVGNLVGLFPTWTVHGINQTYGFTSGRWYLNHNMIDFEWGRDICVCNYLSLRPHLGLKGGWLYQDFYVKYSEPDALVEVREAVFSAYNDFAGVGPRIGLDGSWYLGNCGFSVFGNFATALLYGKTKLRQIERSLSTMSNPPNVYVEGGNVTDDFHQLAPHLQLILGLAWDRSFCGDRFFSHISAGWEMNYWWDQFHLRAFSGVRGGDFDFNKAIMLQGLTVQAGLGF